MVSGSVFQYRPANASRDFGALVQASFHLWLASLRASFRDGLMVSLLAQLPLLPWWWSTRGPFSQDPLQAWLDPSVRQTSAAMLAFGLLMNLASLWFLLSLLRRQGLLARGQALGMERSLEYAWRRLPAALLATATYCGLSLLALAPVGLAFGFGLAGDDALRLLLALLVGLLLAAVPLAWVSIAAAFIYPPILLDGHGGWSAQQLSFRLVRGHWVRCASVLSLAMLAGLGILGVVGAAPFLLTGAIVVADDGMQALLRPGWLVFGQLLSTPLMALLLPLVTATYLVCYEDLKWRRPGALKAR